jgi:Ohr subfamily peroxiredoxin
MSVKILYKTSSTANGGGRDGGRSKSSDSNLDIKMVIPKELGGPGGEGNNPEQLFATGYAACFLGALRYASTQGAPKTPADATVKATVGMGPRSDQGFGLEVDLEISLPGLSSEDADKLIEAAHKVCPYSHATRNNIEVRSHVLATA